MVVRTLSWRYSSSRRPKERRVGPDYPDHFGCLASYVFPRNDGDSPHHCLVQNAIIDQVGAAQTGCIRTPQLIRRIQVLFEANAVHLVHEARIRSVDYQIYAEDLGDSPGIDESLRRHKIVVDQEGKEAQVVFALQMVQCAFRSKVNARIG